jgi:hypothetical protein
MNDNSRYFKANKNEEIIVSTYTDSLNYYLDIHFNNNKFFKCWVDDFVGKTSYFGQRIMVHGEKESLFYFVERELKPQKPCKNVEYAEYDPPTWRVCLNKDLSFCKEKTYKVKGGDISSIQNLAAKYFIIPPDDINEEQQLLN